MERGPGFTLAWPSSAGIPRLNKYTPNTTTRQGGPIAEIAEIAELPKLPNRLIQCKGTFIPSSCDWRVHGWRENAKSTKKGSNSVMKKTICAAKFFGAVIALLCAGSLRAQSVDLRVGVPQASHKTLVGGVTILVSVRSTITDANLIPNSVVLQQVDAQGRLLASWAMADTGGGIFSAQVPLTVPLGSTAVLRVAATFNGTLGQAVSASAEVSPVTTYIDDFSPEGIRTFIENSANGVKDSATFLQHLKPDDFLKDWIFMTATASNQKSDATHPRVIIQSDTSDRVFGFELEGAKDGTKPNLIEYIQWDGPRKRFRFHEIDLGVTPPLVTADKSDCLKCHSVNRPNRTGNGPDSWPYPRPNWDAYDSWGGALPFNRDRIYKGVEAAAMAKILKNDINNKIIAQLPLPDGMTRDGSGNVIIPLVDNGAIGSPDIATPESKSISYEAPNNIPKYSKGGTIKQDVTQGGPFFLMKSSFNCVPPDGPNGKRSPCFPLPPPKEVGTVKIQATNTIVDGGRAVAMFDHLSEFNALRVAKELVDSVGKTNLDSKGNPGKPVDIRPVALAIAMACFDPPTAPDPLTPAYLAKYTNNDESVTKLLLKSLRKRDGQPPADFPALMTDTSERRHSLPQKKANLEAPNVAALFNAYSGGSSPDRITGEVARRSLSDKNSSPPYSRTTSLPPAGFIADTLTDFMIDRELYSATKTVAVFRLFLEPVGEPVDRWEMSIFRGPNLRHTGTYTFADKFRNTYIPAIKAALSDPSVLGAKTCVQLQADSSAAFMNFK